MTEIWTFKSLKMLHDPKVRLSCDTTLFLYFKVDEG